MNKKSTIHCRVYTRVPLAEPVFAESLVAVLHEGGLLEGSLFGTSEPVCTPWDDALTGQAIEMLSTYRNLMIVNKQIGFSAYFMWYAQRTRPWFWTFDFTNKWLSSKKRDAIIRLLTRILLDFDPIFIAGGLSTDWLEKHEVKDSHGSSILISGSGFEIGKGLPGIYWINGFGRDLCNFFAPYWSRIASTSILDLDHRNCKLIRAYEDPGSFTNDERRKREAKITSVLGESYFFDITKASGKRPRKRTPIPNVTDASKL